MAYSRHFDLIDQKYVEGKYILGNPNRDRTCAAIFWQDGELWDEAFKYLLHKSLYLKSVQAITSHLTRYACWLEETGTDWRSFPKEEYDRCIYQFSGYLKNNSELSDSSANSRLNAVIDFYRFAKLHNLIDRNIELWREKGVYIRCFENTYFERTIRKSVAQLPRRIKRKGEIKYPHGVKPRSLEDRNILLKYLKGKKSKKPLYLMLLIGFLTGARQGTIRTLTYQSLLNALPHNTYKKHYVVQAGQGSEVESKNGKNISIFFHEDLLKDLIQYAETDPDQLKRRAKANKENIGLIFLTRQSKPYSDGSITELMSMLRKELIFNGLEQFHDFKFHDTRGTCARYLISTWMESGIEYAIDRAREWLGHENEETTRRYVERIQFEEQSEVFNQLYDQEFLPPWFSGGIS